MFGAQGCQALEKPFQILLFPTEVVQGDIGAGRGVEDGHSGIDAECFDLFPRQIPMHAQALLYGDALRAEPDQASIEAVGEDQRCAELRDAATVYQESVEEAAGLEGDAAEHQLADAEKGEDQALAGSGIGREVEFFGLATHL